MVTTSSEPATRGRGPAGERGYARDRAQVLRRLSRMEGQVRGIARMVERDEYCIDILQQTAALRAAVDAVTMLLMEDHVAGCLRTAVKTGDAGGLHRGGHGRRAPQHGSPGAGQPAGRGVLTATSIIHKRLCGLWTNRGRTLALVDNPIDADAGRPRDSATLHVAPPSAQPVIDGER